MTDIRIRDVPESAQEEIDRRWLSREFRPAVKVSPSDLTRLGKLARDLGDPDVMGRAWA